MEQRENIINYIKKNPGIEFVVLVSNSLRLSFQHVRCLFGAATIEIKD